MVVEAAQFVESVVDRLIVHHVRLRKPKHVKLNVVLFFVHKILLLVTRLLLFGHIDVGIEFR